MVEIEYRNQFFQRVLVRVLIPNSEIRVFVVLIGLLSYLLPLRMLLCIVNFLVSVSY